MEPLIFEKPESPFNRVLLFVVFEHSFRIDTDIIIGKDETPRVFPFSENPILIKSELSRTSVDNFTRFIFHRATVFTGFDTKDSEYASAQKRRVHPVHSQILSSIVFSKQFYLSSSVSQAGSFTLHQPGFVIQEVIQNPSLLYPSIFTLIDRIFVPDIYAGIP